MEPYYSDDAVTLYLGKMEDVLPSLQLQTDAIVTDPPYGETSLGWDKWPEGWPSLVAAWTNSMWCFGSLRMFARTWDEFAGWKLSQDVIWEKQAGSGFAADRFKRVHEIAVHFYRGEWRQVYHQAVREAYHGPDKHPRVSTSKTPHTGEIGGNNYEDDGTRLVRSVIKARNLHGRAIHPTEKPAAILAPLIEYAVPVGGIVLDPFAGSASTLLTARTLGRRAIGVEGYEPYCEAAAKRLDVPDLFGSAA